MTDEFALLRENAEDAGLAWPGAPVVRRTSVGDGAAEVHGAVSEALERTGAVLTTGGLGPTRDDITKAVVAGLFGLPLEFREDLWTTLLERYRRVGRTPTENNRCQAEVPRGATVLVNRWGSAPGLWIEGPLPGGRPGLAILLPGVPREMRKLLEHEVLPRLAPRATGRVIRSRTLRTSGIPESTLAERIGDVEQVIAPLTLAYLPGISGVDLRVTAWDFDPAEADRRLTQALELLESRAVGVFGRDGADLAAVANANRKSADAFSNERCGPPTIGNAASVACSPRGCLWRMRTPPSGAFACRPSAVSSTSYSAVTW